MNIIIHNPKGLSLTESITQTLHDISEWKSGRVSEDVLNDPLRLASLNIIMGVSKAL